MLPTLKQDRIVVGTGWFRRLFVGDVVLISHDGIGKIKRISKIDGHRLYVLGDNPGSSTDSRTFGWLDQNMVIAKLWV